MNKTCHMLEHSSLLNLSCVNVTKPLVYFNHSFFIEILLLVFIYRFLNQQRLSSKCNDNGYIYEIERALELFGHDLPNSLYNNALDLYKSENYIDKVLASALSIAILPETKMIYDLVDINTLFEVRKEPKFPFEYFFMFANLSLLFSLHKWC